jgi:hypothetical protein
VANAYTSEVVATVEKLTFMMKIYKENMDTSKVIFIQRKYRRNVQSDVSFPFGINSKKTKVINFSEQQ